MAGGHHLATRSGRRIAAWLGCRHVTRGPARPRLLLRAIVAVIVGAGCAERDPGLPKGNGSPPADSGALRSGPEVASKIEGDSILQMMEGGLSEEDRALMFGTPVGLLRMGRDRRERIRALALRIAPEVLEICENPAVRDVTFLPDEADEVLERLEGEDGLGLGGKLLLLQSGEVPNWETHYPFPRIKSEPPGRGVGESTLPVFGEYLRFEDPFSFLPVGECSDVLVTELPEDLVHDMNSHLTLTQADMRYALGDDSGLKVPSDGPRIRTLIPNELLARSEEELGTILYIDGVLSEGVAAYTIGGGANSLSYHVYVINYRTRETVLLLHFLGGTPPTERFVQVRPDGTIDDGGITMAPKSSDVHRFVRLIVSELR